MGYIYNGKARSYTVQIIQNIDGVEYTETPQKNMLDFPGSSGVLTVTQFLRLSTADFNARVTSYYNYLQGLYNITLPADLLVGPEILDETCVGAVPEDDTNPPDTNPPDTNPPDTNPPDTNPPSTLELTLTCNDFNVQFINNFPGETPVNYFVAEVNLTSIPVPNDISFTVAYTANRLDSVYNTITGSMVVTISANNIYGTTSIASPAQVSGEDWAITDWSITNFNGGAGVTLAIPYPVCSVPTTLVQCNAYGVSFNNYQPGSNNLWEASIFLTDPVTETYTFSIAFSATRNDVVDTYSGTIDVPVLVGQVSGVESSQLGLAQAVLEDWTVDSWSITTIIPNDGKYVGQAGCQLGSTEESTDTTTEAPCSAVDPLVLTGYDATSEQDACTGLLPGDIYGNGTALNNSSSIWIDGCVTLAPAGYYMAVGGHWRYWTGTSFTSSGTTSCA